VTTFFHDCLAFVGGRVEDHYVAETLTVVLTS